MVKLFGQTEHIRTGTATTINIEKEKQQKKKDLYKKRATIPKPDQLKDQNLEAEPSLNEGPPYQDFW